jgi:hypothetical protein
MAGRALRIDPETLLLVRLVGAIWLIIEWLIMMICMITTFVLVFTETEDDPYDNGMQFLDWVDAGSFTVWSVILLSAPLAAAIGLILNLRGELNGWVRKMCIAVVGANLLGALWWTISLAEGPAWDVDAFVAIGMLVSAVVAAVMALGAPKQVQPATA